MTTAAIENIEPSDAPSRNVPDYLHCVGESFYSVEDFIAEAAQMGISRRLHKIPKDLVPGQSRIYLAHGAGHDSSPRYCTNCQKSSPCAPCGGTGRIDRVVEPLDETVHTCPVKRGRGRPRGTSVPCKPCKGEGTIVDTNDRVRLPPAKEAVTRELNGGEVIRVVICPRCSHEQPTNMAKGGQIFGYFVPDRIEIVLRLSDDAAKAAAIFGQDLGITIEGDTNSDIFRVKGAIDVDDPKANAYLQALGIGADKVEADILGKIRALPGATVVGVAKELKRGCGHRAHGGTYLVAGPTESPLKVLDPTIEYDGPHFRGIVKLSSTQAQDLDDHAQGKRTVVLNRRENVDMEEETSDSDS